MMKKITLTFTLCIGFLFSANIIAQSTATYDINFTSTWNSSDHGTLPINAHWSDLVGASHNSNITFLEMDGTATTGIENVAEAGSNNVFNGEVQVAINAGNAEQWLQQSFSPFAAISSATLSDITVSQEYSLLTLVSMIAPSPDWMIAVNSLDLWDASMNTWKASFTVDLFPYDAGTEDGFGYSGSNSATNPRGIITNISDVAGYPFNSEKIGTLTITLKGTTLGIDDFVNTNEIKIFPNPANTGQITFTNVEELSHITIYDILGKNVKTVSLHRSNEEIVDVSNLNNGMYIVKLINNSGAIESRKLIIN